MRPPGPLTSPAAAIALAVMTLERKDREPFFAGELNRSLEGCDLKRYSDLGSALKWCVRKSAMLVDAIEAGRSVIAGSIRPMKSVYNNFSV